MEHRIDAIYENGVFRPRGPVDIADGQVVSLSINPSRAAAEDLDDIADLLDTEFVEACRLGSTTTPSLEDLRKMLSVFSGSVSDLICEEREER